MSLIITETCQPIAVCPQNVPECYAVAIRIHHHTYALISTPVATFDEALEFRPIWLPYRIVIIRMTPLSDIHDEIATWDGDDHGWVV